MRLTNKQCSEYVAERKEFCNGGRTLFAKHIKSLYVIFSYGYHWPLYAYDFDVRKWYGNKDKYSKTTSRHAAIARPPGTFEPLSLDDMRDLVYHGSYADMIAARLEGSE